MSGRRPIGRITRTYMIALGFVLGSACARPVAPAEPPTAQLELARLRAQLGEREQTIQQLESRLALLEAEQRELRDRVSGATAPRARESANAAICERAPEPKVASGSEGASADREPRPLLRLYAGRHERSERAELTSSWIAPSTHQRLEVVPVPAVGRSAAPHAGRVPVQASSPPSQVPASRTMSPADELYLRALDLMQRREFAEALRELDAFLRGYPEDSRFVRAQVWRGEVLFGQREYARALVAYELALRRAPEGEHAPECLLRIARCHFSLGASERGRASLERLKARFPASEAARRADQVMREDS
jgi:tol-pal system protein YbgF